MSNSINTALGQLEAIVGEHFRIEDGSGPTAEKLGEALGIEAEDLDEAQADISLRLLSTLHPSIAALPNKMPLVEVKVDQAAALGSAFKLGVYVGAAATTRGRVAMTHHQLVALYEMWAKDGEGGATLERAGDDLRVEYPNGDVYRLTPDGELLPKGSS